jgi:predicted PurR-regulated permease PerM
MKMSQRPEDPGATPEQKSAPLPDEWRFLRRPLDIRSVALTGIFLLLVLYTLKVASSFFIPVILAILLRFFFASVIRGLVRFYIPPPLGAAVVIVVMLGTVGFGIYQVASPAGDWIGKFPQTVRQVERICAGGLGGGGRGFECGRA